MRYNFKGDFLGFKFDNVHSSELGIVRVITGNRDSQELSPQFTDNTIKIPGSNGSYFISSEYQPKQFQIDFAYDDLREEDIRRISNLFTNQKTADLIFDETPYKAYSAKVANPIKLNYICFDSEDKTYRIYKGEGSISLTAYQPFARAPYKTWLEYGDLSNTGQWVGTARLLENLDGYDKMVKSQALLYNPGDMSTPLNFIFKVVALTNYVIKYIKNGEIKGIAAIDTRQLQLNEFYRFNSKVGLLESGTYIQEHFIPNNDVVVNNALIAGSFFSIEPGIESDLQILIESSANICEIHKIEYDYLYI